MAAAAPPPPSKTGRPKAAVLAKQANRFPKFPPFQSLDPEDRELGDREVEGEREGGKAVAVCLNAV